MSDPLKRQKSRSLCFGLFAENHSWYIYYCILIWKSYVLALSTGHMFTVLEVDDVSLSNLFYYVTAQCHSDLKQHFWKGIDRKRQDRRFDGRTARGFRGCVPRGVACAPVCRARQVCVISGMGGWQTGGSREACGAWRALALWVKNVWSAVWSQPHPPGMPGRGCLGLFAPHPCLPSGYGRSTAAEGHIPGLVAWWRRVQSSAVFSCHIVYSHPQNRLNVFKANWIPSSTFFFSSAHVA